MEEIGTNWVKLAWGPVSPFDRFRIRIFRSSDNFLLSTTTTTQGSANAIINGIPHVPCYATIHAVCLDDSEGPESMRTPDFITIIIEVLLQAYESDKNQTLCITTSDFPKNKCTFSNNIMEAFEVSYGGYYRKFGVEYNSESCSELSNKYTAHLKDEQNPISIQCIGDVPNPCCISISNDIQLWFGPNHIGWIHISKNETTQGVLGVSGVGGLTVRHLGDSSNDRGKVRDEYFQSPQLVSASPNPFNEILDVFPGRPAAENIQLQLFNLSGQKVLDQRFPGGQEKYSLSTEGLSTGFYLLRIEADGEVQTLKVVKSE